MGATTITAVEAKESTIIVEVKYRNNSNPGATIILRGTLVLVEETVDETRSYSMTMRSY
jgi:hypothetical protein